ncbi:TetR/AcrR family transcriptional regulator [Mycolicibacterium palauense]|uniref:TetR/AcrR family transcriptional regulator n=1 Tax=Mycolicibacterium palauense TaxID=2034511 RepID=UPI000BFF139A|nr:TetR/AcrR family transcriptional regulator [Mycolicibacterium palauense]
MTAEGGPRRRRAARGHGDELRDEILRAATDLLLESGNATAMSIRSVAERVGVTPPSIYLHFADKDALLDAVCSSYFEALHEHIRGAAVGQPTTLDVLRAQGRAYVRFALDNPGLYRIAAMGEGRPGSDVDEALANAAFVHMRQAVATLMDEGVYAPGDPTVVTLELWAAAHGVAALLISKPYLPFGDVESFTDRVLRAACVGQIVTGSAASDATPSQLLGWLSDRKGMPS